SKEKKDRKKVRLEQHAAALSQEKFVRGVTENGYGSGMDLRWRMIPC
ncbi:hypothetical protein A2U01_0084456, partial [Trifolium medium]|nr:hypothetical protein [Trifolium medium]